MTTGYIEACQPLPWRQSFYPGPYAWTWSGWRRYGSPSDETEPASSRSGETEPATLGETEPAPKGARGLEVGRDGARGLGRDETRVLGVGRDRARGLGRDGTRVLCVRRDGARTQGVGRDLLIRLEPSGEVSVGTNFFALGTPNIDTRHIPYYMFIGFSIL